MALVKTLDKYDLQEEFKAMNRDYFSLDGYQALIDFFDEIDDGKNTDLDVVAICCDFNEEKPSDIYENYSNIDEIAETRNDDGSINIDKFIDALNEHTWAMLLDNNNILYLTF